MANAMHQAGPAPHSNPGVAVEARRVYWDAGQVAPPSAAAIEAYTAALADGWADPARLHTEGRRSGMLLEGARQAVAAVLGVPAEAVAFTGSFALAAQAAVLGTLAGRHRTGNLFVHSRVEHSAVLAAAQAHEAAGGRVSAIGVDRSGRIDPAQAEQAVARPGVAAVAVQLANGEVGTRQPVEQVQQWCRAAGVPLVMDVSQSLGHAPVPADTGQVLVADPQAWGSVPGAGVLVVRPGTRWRSVAPPDPAVPADRPGTPGGCAVPAALAAAVSLQQVLADRRADARRREAVGRLRERLPHLAPDLEVVGDPEHRLPHVLTFSALFVDGEAIVGELDRHGFAVGSGSACTASTLEPSHVLAAMDVLTQGNVRIAIPADVPADVLDADVDRFLHVFPQVLRRVRDQLGTADL